MLILALEQSAQTASVALLEGGACVAERTWTQDRRHNRTAFSTLPSLLARQGRTLRQIDAFAVGLGPGSFTGLRMAIAGVQGMALPGNKPVQGIPSGLALAAAAHAETGARRIAVVGDARQGRLWTAAYLCACGEPQAYLDLQLTTPGQLADTLGPVDRVVTSDWSRIGTLLPRVLPETAILPHARFPHARSTGELAFRRLSEGADSPPLRPLYLNPPARSPYPSQGSAA